MKSFDIKDFTDQLPNFGYIEVRLLPADGEPRLDLAKTAKTMLEIYGGFKNTAMKKMVPQFFDVLITDEYQNVNTKFTFSINPHNSTASSFHLLRIQITNGTIPMVDAFRNLPNDQLLAMFSHALGLMIQSEE